MKKNKNKTALAKSETSITAAGTTAASLAHISDEQAADLGVRAQAIEQLALMRGVKVPNSFSVKLYPDGTTSTLHIDAVRKKAKPQTVPTDGAKTERFAAESDPEWYDSLAHDVMRPFLDEALDAYREALGKVIIEGLPK